MHINIAKGSYDCYMDFLHRIDEEFHLTHEESVWTKFNKLLIRKAFDKAFDVLSVVFPDEEIIEEKGIHLFGQTLPVAFYYHACERVAIYGAIAWHNNNVILPSPRCNRALVAPLTCSIHT
jgi:hypothetical protein